MELENLVDKIAREVMENLKDKTRWNPGDTRTATIKETPPPVSSFGLKKIILLVGSDLAETPTIQESLSYIRKKNLDVTLSLPSSRLGGDFGSNTIRCSNVRDCITAVKASDIVAILVPDVATLSRLANLTGDRLDIEGIIIALEMKKEVWAIIPKREYPPSLNRKVKNFTDEIQSMGIQLISDIDVSIPLPFSSPSPLSPPPTCSGTSSGECGGCGQCTTLASDKVQKVVEQGADRISSGPGAIAPKDIAGMIDHTLLKPDATREQILQLCQEARKYGFASCCVNPGHVKLTAECLKGSPVKTCTVIGFPLGATTSMVKAMETRDAIADGADEIDMVINVGALKSGDYDLVRRDIEAVVQAAKGKIVKVILETALLNDDEKIKGCQLSKQAGADFVKTSTGFGPGGATAKDIALMRKTVGKYMGVKASGGIRDFNTAKEMIEAGATRIGASASVAMVKGEQGKSAY